MEEEMLRFINNYSSLIISNIYFLANGQRLSAVLVFYVQSAWNRKRLKNQSKNFILIFNSVSSDEYVAD